MIATNAAGALNKDYEIGDVMIMDVRQRFFGDADAGCVMLDASLTAAARFSCVEWHVVFSEWHVVCVCARAHVHLLGSHQLHGHVWAQPSRGSQWYLAFILRCTCIGCMRSAGLCG